MWQHWHEIMGLSIVKDLKIITLVVDIGMSISIIYIQPKSILVGTDDF